MGETLGGFEKLLLLAVLQRGDDAYGAALFEEIEARTGRGVAPGSVYVALRRLEKKGLVRGHQGDASPERGGRPKKRYRLLPAGLEALRDARREWDAMADGLDAVLGGEA